MRINFTLVATIIYGCVLSGCSSNKMPDNAATALRNGTNFRLLALHPNDDYIPQDELGAFDGCEIVRNLRISDPSTRESVVNAFTNSVNSSNDTVASCFIPRHAISISHESKQYDFLICFECLQCRWYVDDQLQITLPITDSGRSKLDEILAN